MLKKKFLIFSFFILLAFALLSYQSVKGGGHYLDLPLYPLRLLEQASTAVIRNVVRVFNTYIMLTGMEDENRMLQQKLDGADEEKNRYMEAFLENKRLRSLLELKNRRPDYVTSAEVFARDPTNWFQMMWINKGEEDGILKDMVAVTPHGPVGRIHRVFRGGANIILITDVNSSVAVRIQSSRVEGILEGRGDDRCLLQYVAKDAPVKVGDKLITSGLDGIYPEGLQIGLVENIKKDDKEVFLLIEVVPSQDMDTVEEVAILKK